MHNDTKTGQGNGSHRRVIRYLLLVVAYVVSGKLGLTLALPPGYASAIFPPAGIAVAAALIGGRGVLPWVFLGSLLLNIWTGYSATHSINSTCLISATIIASASALQAAVGGEWLRRLIGYPTTLDNGPLLLRFFGATPIICLVSATLSLAGLWATGVIDQERLAINWGTWWVGDTLGVLVMLPLVMVALGEPRPLWRSRFRRVALPMTVAFVLFVLFFVRVTKWEHDDSLMEFRLQSQHLVDLILARLDEQASLLEQMSGLFKASSQVTREEFHRFVEKPLTRFPMVQAMEWAPRIEGSQRADFEQMQQSAFPGFEIRGLNSARELQRTGEQDHYYPLTFVEPSAGNEPALGFDLASSARRRAALDKAIENGGIVTTSPIKLVQVTGPEKTGVLLLLAVKDGQRVRGLVLSVLEMRGFVEKLLPADNASLYLRLEDLDDRQMLYDSLPPQPDPISESRTLEFGTRRYRLQTAPTPLYLQQHQGWQSWGALVTGLLGTGLLGALLLYGSGYTARMETQVAERTTRLRRSESLLKDAQHLAHIGSWELEVEKNHLVWSDEIYNIFEIDPHSFGASYEAFLGIVHPEDRTLVDRAYKESIENRTPYEFEHRLLLSHGRTKYVREHGETFYGEHGQPLRSVGTVQDITEQQAAEEARRKAAEELEDLYNHAPCGYHSLDRDGVFIRINDTELLWLGYSRNEVLRKMRITDLYTPTSIQTFKENFPHIMEQGHAEDLEFEFILKDGTLFIALISATAVYDEAGNYLMSSSTMFDITARKRMERELRESEVRFRNTLEYASIGMSVVSLGGQFIQVNHALCDIVGYSREELEKLNFQTITHPDDLSLDLANVKRLLDGETSAYQLEKRYIRKDGQSVWVQLTGTLLRDTNNKPQYFIAQIEDITERKRSQEQIRQLAYYDTLTGLANRRLMLDRLEHALDQAKRFQRSMAIMFLDLDRFKQINDTLGHDVGDELLKAVAARLITCIRHGDTVSRQGGDEFIIVLTEIAHSHDAAQVAEKVLTALSQPVVIPPHELHITTSIGIAVYPVNGTDDMLELMKKADMAMYTAKEAGRNQYSFYPPEPV